MWRWQLAKPPRIVDASSAAASAGGWNGDRMDGLVGIALLVGLAVLAMPVLLVVALLSRSRLKAR